MLVLLGSLLFSLSALANPEIQVQRTSKLEVQEGVKLKDIALISGLDEEHLQRIGNIEIIQIPTNATRNLTGFQISKILRKSLIAVENEIGEKIKVTVPPVVRIQNMAFKLDEENVKQKIVAEFKKLCGECEFKFSRFNLPQFNGVGGDAAWMVDFPGGKLPRGNFSISLRVGEKLFSVNGEVKILKHVPVALRNINIGERLAENDFNFELRDITLLNDGIPERKNLLGRQISRGVPVNEPITYGNLAKELPVKAGQAVRIISENEWLQITLNGIAQERGEVGDRIRILNPNTKAILSAIVEAPGVVRIQ